MFPSVASFVASRSIGGGKTGFVLTCNTSRGTSGGTSGITGKAISEKTLSVNYISGSSARLGTGSESKDGVRKGIDGISVVEWLSTEGLVEDSVTNERVTVGYVKVRLDNPDKFFAWVVEIEFDLVG